MAAEARFNQKRWLEARDHYGAYLAAAGESAEYAASGLIERRLSRCKMELATAGSE